VRTPTMRPRSSDWTACASAVCSRSSTSVRMAWSWSASSATTELSGMISPSVGVAGGVYGDGVAAARADVPDGGDGVVVGVGGQGPFLAAGVDHGVDVAAGGVREVEREFVHVFSSLGSDWRCGPVGPRTPTRCVVGDGHSDRATGTVQSVPFSWR